MCLLYTTKLEQSQQVLSEAMIHDEDPTWVAIVSNSRRSVLPQIAEQLQRRGPPKNSWGDPRCTNFNRCGRGCRPWCAMPMRHWCEALRCHPFQQTLRPGPRRPSNITRTMKVQSTKKKEKFRKAFGLTTWTSLWSLCVVASGLPGWDIGFMKWGRDGVGERWDLTDGHAHDVTLGQSGGASPKYAEYDVAPKNWTCFAWDKPAHYYFWRLHCSIYCSCGTGCHCQDDAIA